MNKTRRKVVEKKIMFVGRITWINGCGNSDRAKKYVSRRKNPMNEKYVDGSVGAVVRMMMKRGCLPVRESTMITWKYDDMHCVCGDVESEKHVVLDCNLCVDMTRR